MTSIVPPDAGPPRPQPAQAPAPGLGIFPVADPKPGMLGDTTAFGSHGLAGSIPRSLGLLSNLSACAPASTEFSAQARAVFAKIDQDGDGYLSRNELNRALRDPAIKGKEAAAVAAMVQLRGNLEELSNDEFGDENDGITLKDLDVLESRCQGDATLQESHNWYHHALNKINGTNRTLFPNGIHPEAPQQGAVADCYFIAALSGLADQNPAAIRQMIQGPDAQGDYQVTFPGKKPIRVKPPTDGEIGLYGTAMGDGLWVSLLEKAYAQYANDDAWISRQHDYDKIDSGSVAGRAGIPILTGKDPTFHFIALRRNSTLLTKMSDALRDKRLVVATINKSFSKTTKDGLPTGHTYTVLKVEDNHVTIRNPWKTGGPKGDGIHRLTKEQFFANFSTIALQDA